MCTMAGSVRTGAFCVGSDWVNFMKIWRSVSRIYVRQDKAGRYPSAKRGRACMLRQPDKFSKETSPCMMIKDKLH